MQDLKRLGPSDASVPDERGQAGPRGMVLGEEADVAELRRYVSLPFDLDEGRGAARAWIELQAGQWREMTADVALADVSLRMASRQKSS